MVIEVNHRPEQAQSQENENPNGHAVGRAGRFRIVRVRTRGRPHLAWLFGLSFFAVRIHYWFVLDAFAVWLVCATLFVSGAGLGFGFKGASKIGVLARKVMRYSTSAVASRVGMTS